MDVLVEEIFQRHSSNQEELTFEEWAQWFLSLEGMKEVLEMRPHGGPPGGGKGGMLKAQNTSGMYGKQQTVTGSRSRERMHGGGNSGMIGGAGDKNSSFNSGRPGGR